MYLCASERIGTRDRERSISDKGLLIVAAANELLFFVRVCVRECMISSGDRILRACSNWRANANAWLVALHQLVLKSEVAHSAVQGLALGQKQILVALDSFSFEPLNICHRCTSRISVSCSTIRPAQAKTHTCLSRLLR